MTRFQRRLRLRVAAAFFVQLLLGDAAIGANLLVALQRGLRQFEILLRFANIRLRLHELRPGLI